MIKQRKFGVWMDNHQATIVGYENEESDKLAILAQVKSEHSAANSSEKTAHNHEQSVQLKFFKEIASHLLNPVYVHITGTGQAQEQFIHFLADTPQFKNVKTAESTANKMNDEKLLEYFSAQLQ
jgi:DNA-binding FadR family transcriptional regulator